MSNQKKTLSDIFDNLARALKDGVDFRDEDGKPNAPLLNVARQFLKDNNWEAEIKPGTPVGDLADSLPSFDDDDLADNTVTPRH